MNKDIDINSLESQVETLLSSRFQLQDEMASLRHKLAKLTQERAELMDKNRKAAAMIKRIVSQLRNELP